jgi:DNA-binding transcriptional MerR regulator
MIDFTHEDIERLWNSITHYVPERSKLDAAIDFIKSLEDIGVEVDEIKASAEYDPKLEEAINTVFEEENEEEEYSEDE